MYNLYNPSGLIPFLFQVHADSFEIQPISSRDFTSAQNKHMEDTNISSWIAGRNSYRIIRRREYNASTTRLTTLKSAQVFKVQQVDYSAKAEIQRKIHDLEEVLADAKNEIEIKKGEHQRLKQVHQAAQAERRAIETEKSEKQQEAAKWQRMKAALEPSEEELKQKLAGGENYKANLQKLNEKQEALVIKKAKEALGYGVCSLSLLQVSTNKNSVP